MLSGPLHGQTLCEKMNLDFTQVFANQFVITPNAALDVPGFDRMMLGDWAVFVGPDLPRLRLSDRRGHAQAVLLGLASDGGDTLIAQDYLADLDRGDPGYDSAVRDRAEALVGRWLLLALPGGHAPDLPARLYCDAGCTLSAVYDPTTRTVASTLNMALGRAPIPNPVIPPDRVQAGEAVYTLSQTPDAHVRLIRTNHYLDMTRFEPVRHWPRSPLPACPDPQEVPNTIAQDMRRSLSNLVLAVGARRNLVLGLSGGRDSRLMAAALGPVLGRIRMVYGHATNFMTRVDVMLGQRIAETLKVPYRVLDTDDPDHVAPRPFAIRQARRAFAIATGGFGTILTEDVLGLTRHLPPGAVLLRGGLLDISRAVWWRGWPKRRTQLGTGEAEQMLNLVSGHAQMLNTADSPLRTQYRAWRKTLPPDRLELIHDYIFLEFFYLASWQRYYGTQGGFCLCMGCDRALIDAFLSVPVETRFSAELQQDLVRALSPELADIPTHFELRQHLRDMRS
jgi:hypothetical protein